MVVLFCFFFKPLEDFEANVVSQQPSGMFCWAREPVCVPWRPGRPRAPLTSEGLRVAQEDKFELD